MKMIKKLLLVILVIILVIIAAVVLLFWIDSKQPAVKNNYYELTQTDMSLEAKYTALGKYEVSYTEYDAENDTYKKYEIWYPAEMKTSEKNIRLL